MHHGKYLHVDFQQTWVSRSVKTERTNIFANVCKLHKFATITIIYFLINYFKHASSKTYMYVIFWQNRVSRSVITVHTNIFAEMASCINLQLPILILEKIYFWTCIIIKRTCTLIFSKIGLVEQSKPCTQICLQNIANYINLQLAIRI